MTSPTRPARPTAPDAHPYPIKTTSTGILTRSNSSSAHGSWARHKYSPAPPSSSPNTLRPDASPTRSERSAMSVSPSPSKYSRSWAGGDRVKLPRHPYLWTPAHLGTYLSTALNRNDGEPLDQEIVQRIVEFVHEQKIGGRAFLGLDQEDFQEMDGVDATWADAFWDAACTLRAAAAPYRPSRISSGAYKRGRVRGIVGVFERSASESSDAGEDDMVSRLRGSSVSGSGYESTGDEAAPDNVPVVRRSAAPTPRPSHVPIPASPNNDHTPHTREVEIVSLTDANAGADAETEPTMAELYETIYGVHPASPTHRLAPSDGDEEIGLGETVKITVPGDTSLESPRGEVIALPTPAPPSLTEFFVPALAIPAPVPAPERHVLMPSPVIADPPTPHNVYVLPSSNDEAALRALDALKARLVVVEDRIAAMELKEMANGDAASYPRTHGDAEDDTPTRWSETRQSASVLLAGATAGVSLVLIPLLFRHLWTR